MCLCVCVLDWETLENRLYKDSMVDVLQADVNEAGMYGFIHTIIHTHIISLCLLLGSPLVAYVKWSKKCLQVLLLSLYTK